MIRLLSCFILACLSQIQFVLGEGLPVQEVQTSIHEKAVTGYRVLLGRGLTSVREGIQTHLADFGEKALDFEGVLIYENIEYPPITASRPVTLYYFVKNIEDLMTEVTLVGIYDYQEIITAQQSPDLALRMLLDYSELTRRISGDSLAFDPIFDRTSVDELLAKYEDRKARTTLDFFVEQQQDRIASGSDMLVRNDPFNKKRPDNFETDDRIVAEISTRFRNYTIRPDEKASPFLKPDVATRVAILQDSLSRLQKNLALLALNRDSLQLSIASMETTPVDTIFMRDTLTLYAEAEPLRKSESGGESIEETDELAYAQELLKQYEEEIHSLTTWGDSLLMLIPDESSEAVARIAAPANDKSEEQSAQLAQLEADNIALQDQLAAQLEAAEQTKKELAQTQTLREQIVALENSNQALQDSLSKVAAIAEDVPATDVATLESQIAALTTQIRPYKQNWIPVQSLPILPRVP